MERMNREASFLGKLQCFSQLGSEKRGQNMTLGTIIVIVLGIAVLVFLIFGFTSGWGNLWDRVVNLGGGKTNVDTIAQACENACASNNIYEFCSMKRTIKYGSKLEQKAWDGKNMTMGLKESPGTCDEISFNSTRYPGVVVAKCPKILCSPN